MKDIPETLKKDMEIDARRKAGKKFVGSMAEPRTFVKPGTYTGAELMRRWRATMWDDVPSRMADERHYRVPK